MVKIRVSRLLVELEGISDREREILICICKLQIQKEIALSLHISKKTVSAHLRNTYIKLGIYNLNDNEIAYVLHVYVRQALKIFDEPVINDLKGEETLSQEVLKERNPVDNIDFVDFSDPGLKSKELIEWENEYLNPTIPDINYEDNTPDPIAQKIIHSRDIEVDPALTDKSKEFIELENEYLNPTTPEINFKDNAPDPIELEIIHRKNIEVELPNNQFVLIPTNYKEFNEKLETDQEFYSLVIAETKMTLIPRKNGNSDIPRNRFYLFLFIGVGLAFIGAYAILTTIIDTGPEIVYLPGETQVSIVEKEVTREVTSAAGEVISVSLPTQTARVEQIVVTATSLPPTPTNVPAPVLEAGIIFSDDFDLGPDPAWEVINGDPGMANGNYTVVAPFNESRSKHFSVVSDLYWDNVSIEFEILNFRSHSGLQIDGQGALILHYIPDTGGVGLIFYPGRYGILFGLIDSYGQWTLLDSTFVEGSSSNGFDFTSSSSVFRVEIIDNIYFVYIDEELITSASIPDYDYGLTGLWMLNSKNQNEPKYYAPRFGYITIESLP
jgi:DNA-binding CsgD family transcriptional regulator